MRNSSPLTRLFLVGFSMLLCTASARAEEQVVLGMSQNRISITANFDGSEILIFGAIKRENTIPDGDPIQVIVAIEGPSQTLQVRHKEKRFGIWINTETVEIDSAPAFYAIATSAPFSSVISDTEDLKHQISIPRVIRSVGAPMSIKNAQPFSEAVIRIRQNNGLYQLLENAVIVDQQTLFRTNIALPANLTEGNYRTRIFLSRHSKVIATYETVIDVRKVGLERFLFNLSREKPLIYGLLSLAIAIAAGWGASAIFRIFQRN